MEHIRVTQLDSSVPHYLTHHKDLKTFPYHVHLPDGVKESKRVTLLNVLDKIESVVVAKLESDVE